MIFNDKTVKSVNETNCESIIRSKFNAKEEDNINQYNITNFTKNALLKNIRVDFKFWSCHHIQNLWTIYQKNQRLDKKNINNIEKQKFVSIDLIREFYNTAEIREDNIRENDCKCASRWENAHRFELRLY